MQLPNTLTDKQIKEAVEREQAKENYQAKKNETLGRLRGDILRLKDFASRKRQEIALGKRFDWKEGQLAEEWSKFKVRIPKDLQEDEEVVSTKTELFSLVDSIDSEMIARKEELVQKKKDVETIKKVKEDKELEKDKKENIEELTKRKFTEANLEGDEDEANEMTGLEGFESVESEISDQPQGEEE